MESVGYNVDQFSTDWPLQWTVYFGIFRENNFKVKVNKQDRFVILVKLLTASFPYRPIGLLLIFEWTIVSGSEYSRLSR